MSACRESLRPNRNKYFTLYGYCMYLAMLVIVICKIYSWIRVLVSSPPRSPPSQELTSNFLELKNLVNHQGGRFLASANAVSLCPMTEVCSVFRNEIWPSCAGGEPRSTACIVLGVSRTSLTIKLRGCPTPVPGGVYFYLASGRRATLVKLFYVRYISLIKNDTLRGRQVYLVWQMPPRPEQMSTLQLFPFP